MRVRKIKGLLLQKAAGNRGTKDKRTAAAKGQEMRVRKTKRTAAAKEQEMRVQKTKRAAAKEQEMNCKRGRK